jgi:NAD(P)H-quinone oxidoreductase subunit 5
MSFELLGVLAAPASLAAVSGLASRHPGARPRTVIRAASWAAGLGVLIAVGAAMSVAVGGPATSPLIGLHELGIALRLDALSVTMLLMVTLLGFVVLRFSCTYLDGDRRQGAFIGRIALTIAAVEVLLLSGNLLVLFVAWVGTSLSLHRLLLFYSTRPRARLAARKKFIVARLGDACLLVAFALLYVQLGSGDLATVLSSASSARPDTLLALATVLMAVAALLKSAQFPTHGWLIEVMETPTPVSALLHAGILNAGPFLLLRFAAVMELGYTSSLLLVLFGGFTALFASVALLTQPSIKVALGYSSAAHMGFMLLVCGLGVYPAAALHLVAHSFYKAHAFLSSGSVIDVARSKRVLLANRLRSPWRLAGSVALALLTYLATAVALGLRPWTDPSLLAVGAIVVIGISQLLAPSLDSHASARAMLRTIGLALLVALAFFGLESAAGFLLAGALPQSFGVEAGQLALASVVIGMFALVVLVQMAALSGRSGLARAAHVHLRNGLYANTVFDRLVGGLRV